MKYPLNINQKQVVRVFLSGWGFTRGQYDSSYGSWAKGGHGWDLAFGSGGTDTMNAIMWYQHVFKPGTKEWRPKIIMNAICEAADVN